MRTRHILGIVILCAATLCVVVGVQWFRAGPPETPGNAVLDFQNHVVLEEYDAAWDRVCSKLKMAPNGGQGADFGPLNDFLQHAGNVSTNYATQVNGNTAREPITVRPRGAPDDRSNEQWVVTLVKEDGKWRVCGYERAA